MAEGLTLTIVGGDRWATPQTPEEAQVMAGYVAAIGDVPERCRDCAFRPGSDANRSQLVLKLIEHSLLLEGRFCCHHGDDPERICAGYAALLESQGDVRITTAAL